MIIVERPEPYTTEHVPATDFRVHKHNLYLLYNDAIIKVLARGTWTSIEIPNLYPDVTRSGRPVDHVLPLLNNLRYIQENHNDLSLTEKARLLSRLGWRKNLNHENHA